MLKDVGTAVYMQHTVETKRHYQAFTLSLFLVSVLGIYSSRLPHISPLEHLFFLKILSHTQWATEVKKIVGFSLKPLRSKVMVLLAFLRHLTCIRNCRSMEHVTLSTTFMALIMRVADILNLMDE